MIDGRMEPLAASRQADSGQRIYSIPVTVELVRRMSTATRVAGRICEEEWRIEERAQLLLREWLARVDEELAWASQATSGGEEPTGR